MRSMRMEVLCVLCLLTFYMRSMRVDSYMRSKRNEVMCMVGAESRSHALFAACVRQASFRETLHTCPANNKC